MNLFGTRINNVRMRRRFEAQESTPASIAILIQGVLVCLFVLHFLALSWYFGVDYAPRISWISNDGAWDQQYSFGNHYFSDYLQIWVSSKDSNWMPSNIYPPFAVLIIKAFTWIPYKISLIFYLSTLAICTLLPIYLVNKKRDISTQVAFLIIFGIFSVPFISIIDRGNIIGILPLLFYFALTCSHKKPLVIGFLVGLIAAIKVYPLVFILFFPKAIRLRAGLVALFTFLSLNLAAAFFWGNPWSISKSILSAQKLFIGLNLSGDPMNFSASSILLNISNVVLGKESQFSEQISKNYLPISLLLLVILLLSAHLGFRRSNPITFPFLGLYSLQLLPVISYTYTRWWGLVVAALLLNNSFMGNKRDLKYEAYIWITVILNMALLSFNNLNPVSIFPTLAFICFLLFCIYDIALALNKNLFFNSTKEFQ